MSLGIREITAHQKAADLLVTTKTGSYSEALDAGGRLKSKAIENAIQGDFDTAGIYATAAYKAGATTPEELVGRIIALTLVDIDKAKARETKVTANDDPERLTLFGRLSPGIPTTKLNENHSSDPRFAAHIIRENLQGLANRGEAAFLALLGLKAKQQKKQEEPMKFQTMKIHHGCSHRHDDI